MNSKIRVAFKGIVGLVNFCFVVDQKQWAHRHRSGNIPYLRCSNQINMLTALFFVLGVMLLGAFILYVIAKISERNKDKHQ